jgi:hypothetical protein
MPGESDVPNAERPAPAPSSMAWNAPRLPPGPIYPQVPEIAPVWVRLDEVFRHPADAPRSSVADGLDLVGDVPGMVQVDFWVRSHAGMWLAVCSFDIPHADAVAGGHQVYRARDQLVPGYALRPRPKKDRL